MPKKLTIWTGVLALLLGCNAGEALLSATPTAPILEPPAAPTPSPGASPPAVPYDIPGTLTALPLTGPCEAVIFTSHAAVLANPWNPEEVLGSAELGAAYPVVGQFLSEFGRWYQIRFADQLGWIPANYGDGDQLVAATQGDCSQVPVVEPPAQP